MKVFVRTSDLTSDDPHVIAFYADDSGVADNAHGNGMTVLTLPLNALSTNAMGMMFLAKDWRARGGSSIVDSEAKRRIEEAFSVSEQVSALRELLEAIILYGPDVLSWPTDARTRKAEIDEMWNYVGEIRERARAHAPAPPLDPGNDKVWPMRLARRNKPT